MYANPSDLKFFGAGDQPQTVTCDQASYINCLEVPAYSWTAVAGAGCGRGVSAARASARYDVPTFADIRTTPLALGRRL